MATGQMGREGSGAGVPEPTEEEKQLLAYYATLPPGTQFVNDYQPVNPYLSGEYTGNPPTESPPPPVKEIARSEPAPKPTVTSLPRLTASGGGDNPTIYPESGSGDWPGWPDWPWDEPERLDAPQGIASTQEQPAEGEGWTEWNPYSREPGTSAAIVPAVTGGLAAGARQRQQAPIAGLWGGGAAPPIVRRTSEPGFVHIDPMAAQGVPGTYREGGYRPPRRRSPYDPF